jgi:5-methylcytosine-specific restriction endonuclease McrA
MATWSEEFEHEVQLAEIAGILNAQHARVVDVAARAFRDGGWFGEGIHSFQHWLTINLGVCSGQAKKIATIAARVEDFPLVIAAFDRGELSLDQVYVVAAKAPAWADALMVNFASVATVRQLQRTIRDKNFEGDPDQPKAPAPAAADSLGMRWDDDGRLRLPGSLDADDGAIVEGAMNEARDALFEAGQRDVSCGDALVEIARRSLESVPADRRERFVPHVHVHTDTGTTQLTNGVQLPPAIRDYLLCHSKLHPVWERDNIAFGGGRTQRSVPDRLRRLIEHRDQGCRVPGCAMRFVHIHHIKHWSDGGETESHNLLSLCRRHHKLHHMGQLGIEGNADMPDGVVFSDAKGRTLADHARPQPPTGPPPKPEIGYEHPTGERLQPMWTGLGWAHPNALAKRRQRLIDQRDHQPTAPVDPSEVTSQALAS